MRLLEQDPTPALCREEGVLIGTAKVTFHTHTHAHTLSMLGRPLAKSFARLSVAAVQTTLR